MRYLICCILTFAVMATVNCSEKIKDVDVSKLPQISIVTVSGRNINGILEAVGMPINDKVLPLIKAVLERGHVVVHGKPDEQQIILIFSYQKEVQYDYDTHRYGRSMTAWGEYCLNLYLLQKGWVKFSDKISYVDPKLKLAEHINALKNSINKIPEFVELLQNKDSNENILIKTIYEISTLGHHAQAAIPMLIRCLDNTNLRPHAIQALGMIGDPSREVISAITNLIERDPENSILSLTELNAITDESELVLLKIVEERSGRERLSAAKALFTLSKLEISTLNQLKILKESPDLSLNEKACLDELLKTYISNHSCPK